MKINIKEETAPATFQKFGKLPGRPSALIRLAINDLRAVEKMRSLFTVDMGRWAGRDSSGKKCAVCLAGSVMANTLSKPDKFAKKIINGDVYSNPDPEDFANEDSALCALDNFRMGSLSTAFDELGLHLPDNFYAYIPVERYEDDKVKFKKKMLALADALEAEGY